MANFFEQFHTAKEKEPSENFFAQFDKQPEKKKAEPESDSIWTTAADFTKKVLGSAISGVAGIPVGLEQGLKGTARKSMEGEPEALMPSSVYQPGLDTEETLFGPETDEQKARRKLQAQRAVTSIPELPGARALNRIGKGVQQSIEDSVSEKTKKAVKESEVTGNIFKGEIDFGSNPTVRGYAMQAASVFGSLAPVIATAVITKSPTAGGVAGGAMAAEEAGTSAAEYIGKLSHEQLLKDSPFYATMIEGGADQAEARDLTIKKAAETGAVLQGLVATFGDRFTGKLVTGAFDDMLKKVAGKSVIARTGAGAGISSAEEGLQEVTEGVASDIGVKNVVKSKEIGEESAANLILGALGGAGPGGYRGLKEGIADKYLRGGEEKTGKSVLDRLTEEEDVGQVIPPAGGAGTSLAGKPGAGGSAGRITELEPDGMVSTGSDVTDTTGRERQQPSSLDEFRRQYDELRTELAGLISIQRPTEADLRTMKIVSQNLSDVVDANADIIKDRNLIQQLKNPMFNGTPVLDALATQGAGEARGMQSDMFGTIKRTAQMARDAMAMAGGDVTKAIANLEAAKQRYYTKLQTGGYDENWAISQAGPGLTAGEAVRSRQQLAEQHVARLAEQIDQAIEQLRRPSRGMQGNLFNKPPEEGAPAESMEDVFGLTAEEKARQEAQRKSAEIEKRNKGKTQAVAPSMTPLERVITLEDREADLANRLERLKTEKLGSTIGATEKDIAQSLERELAGVRRDLAAARAEVASGKSTPVITQEKPVTTTPTTVESTQEQTDMFGQPVVQKQQKQEQPKKERRERTPLDEDFEEFGAEVDEETPAASEPVRYNQKGEPIKAPDISTEHVAQTDEGQQVKDFFDVIQPVAETPTEQERHSSSKNVAAKAMLQYDIAASGETTSPGAKAMLKYLTARVAGVDSFKALMAALRRASPEEQGRLFTKAGLPDLTTRRGIEQFSDEVREYISQLSGKETGVSMPKSGVYTERITTGTAVTQKFGRTAEGKPRRPSQGVTENEHVIADAKLRGALLAIKQAFTVGLKMSPQMSAAMTYLNNLNRKTFGEALSALAYDLAYYEVDPKYFNANYGYFGEGGRYAKNFREWIKENLSESTLATLDEMVEEHKKTHAANVAYSKAVTDYHDSLKRYEEQLAKEAKERATIEQKKTERKLKRISERVTETAAEEGEATPDVEVSTKNLPSVQMLTELHPDMIRMLESGDTRGALELMTQMKGNPYYAELAQRLLDTKFTAQTRFIDADTMESLSNDPNIGKSLQERIDALRDVIIAIYPSDQQATLIGELRSGKLRNVLSALAQVEASMDQMNASESNKQVLQSLIDLVNTQYAWSGKYDPATDSIVMRRGVGKLTNHLLLHETIHAAASHLLDNPERLSGFQRQGYDRLVELYEYAKTQMQQDGADTSAIYGLSDLHEFVSEALTNPVFQARLRGYRYKAAPYSLQNRFTDAIRRLFNIKKGYESNVMAEAMFAADAMMAGTMSIEGMTVTTGPKAMATGKRKPKIMPKGMPNQPSTLRRWMQTRNWNQVKREFRNIDAALRPAFLGVLTLRQIDDLVAGRIPQINNFIRVTEDFLARKSNILEESAKISRRWELLQSKDPEMSRKLGAVMHAATIAEVDPDKANNAQRNANVQLTLDWYALDPEARAIYREVRDFFQRRYKNYKRLMNRRILQMRQLGVSEATILEIRNEFEKGALKGPYFPLMRHGRFWYQIGRGASREYYMFESQGARDAHIEERLARDPYLSQTIGDNIGNDYAKQMDFHAQQSAFLKEVFAAVDNADFAGLSTTDADARKKELKDSFYQTFLQNQPDRSMRNQFIHRNSIEGFSQDALRNFANTSFNMAYQLARFEYSPEMFSQMDAARAQVRRRTPAGASYDPVLAAENDELRDFIKETELRLNAMLNPPDDGAWVSYFSNIGFIYYLTSVASAVTNILGGIMIGVPTLVAQQIRANPKIGYTRAVADVMGQVSKTVAQIGLTGFGIEKGGRIRDFRLLTPSLERSKRLSGAEMAAYKRFVADGLIDITAAYDQSGLASKPTEDYSGIPNKSMQVISFLFHHAERLNREVTAMSAFRAAMEKRAGYANQQQAFAEAIAEAKDVTNRSMFDYSAPNKPRYMQHPVARVILQFKQFPQQMTFFLARNAYNSFKGLTETDRREARARFVGTMGMAGIMSGVTGLWGFSTVAAIIEAVFNFGMAPDDEDRLDFELEFMNWAVNTLGKEAGMLLGRGAFNALGYDFASKLKLDGMWIPDGRQNVDAETALNDAITKVLGPFVGMAQQGARAYTLFKTGHGDRALEAIMPAFVRQPLVAYRYSKEGATNMAGDKIVDEFSPFDLAMQSIGFRTAELAERQYFNITKKGQAEGITKKRTEALNLFGLYFMTNDADGVEKALKQIIDFNDRHPTYAVDVDGLISSIEKKMEKSAKTDQGLYIDDKLRHIVTQDYVDKLKKESKPAEKKANYFDQFH